MLSEKYLKMTQLSSSIGLAYEASLKRAAEIGSENVFDYIELTDDYSIYEIAVPPSWVGKSILQKSVRTKYNISILATKLQGRISPLPQPEHIFQEGETLMIMGHNKDVRALTK